MGCVAHQQHAGGAAVANRCRSCSRGPMDAIEDSARWPSTRKAAWARQRAGWRRVGAPQGAGVFMASGTTAVGADRERAGAIDEVAGHAEGQQPVGAVEPLAVVVDRAIGVGREKHAVEADAEEHRRVAAEEGVAHAGNSGHRRRSAGRCRRAAALGRLMRSRTDDPEPSWSRPHPANRPHSDTIGQRDRRSRA